MARQGNILPGLPIDCVATFSGQLDSQGRASGQGRVAFDLPPGHHAFLIGSIEGSFREGSPTGEVTIVYPRTIERGEDTYRGHVDDSFTPRGPGEYRVFGGTDYRGTFLCAAAEFWRNSGRAVRQRLDLDGILETAEGFRAEGRIRRGWITGQARITLNGKTFTGDYNSGFQAICEGQLLYPDGRMFKGRFDIDRDHFPVPSEGTMTYPDGRVVSGHFTHDGSRLPSAPVFAERHWMFYAPPLVIAAISAAFGLTALSAAGRVDTFVIFWGLCAALGLLWFAIRLIEARFTTLCVTDTGVVYRAGIFSRETTETLRSTTQAISLKQGVVGRMLDYGTLLLTFDGGTRATARLIRRPSAFMDAARREQ